ncbi:hypothetical protein PR048_003517 [Dryococelus australis]|uniref:Uncharacterized protein n=1 Tax=Dryococelus australis TaxID=614101 RepID=A0ABQ9IND6_9NEOP|nr:hypothetical protein PR048_003517 [Dryococelus australis]
MRVIEVSEETGESERASGIVRHDSHMRKSENGPAGDRARFAWVGVEQANCSATAAPFHVNELLDHFMFIYEDFGKHALKVKSKGLQHFPRVARLFCTLEGSRQQLLARRLTKERDYQRGEGCLPNLDAISSRPFNTAEISTSRSSNGIFGEEVDAFGGGANECNGTAVMFVAIWLESVVVLSKAIGFELMPAVVVRVCWTLQQCHSMPCTNFCDENNNFDTQAMGSNIGNPQMKLQDVSMMATEDDKCKKGTYTARGIPPAETGGTCGLVEERGKYCILIADGEEGGATSLDHS